MCYVLLARATAEDPATAPGDHHRGCALFGDDVQCGNRQCGHCDTGSETSGKS